MVRANRRRRSRAKPKYRDYAIDPAVPTLHRWYDVIQADGQIVVLHSIQHPYMLEPYYKVPSNCQIDGIKRHRAEVWRAGRAYLISEILGTHDLRRLLGVNYYGSVHYQPLDPLGILGRDLPDAFRDNTELSGLVARSNMLQAVFNPPSDWPMLAMLAVPPSVGQRLRLELSYCGHRHQFGHRFYPAYSGIVRYSLRAKVVSIRELTAEEVAGRGLESA